jgi:hypothetical protein
VIFGFGLLNVLAKDPNVFCVPELRIKNESLVSILDSLIQSERKCEKFSDNLIWAIKIKNTNSNNQIIEIYQTGYFVSPTNHQPDGFFDYDGLRFKVSGTKENITKLFYITENLKMFKIKSNRTSKGEITISDGDDYSAWYYILENDTIRFKESYTICP